MHSRFSRSILSWIVFFGIGLWGFALWPGAVAPVFAEANHGAIGGSGAISGGFFADDASLAGMPAIPGTMPAGPLPKTGNGLCKQAITDASAGHQLPPGLLNAVATVESGRVDPRTGAITPWPWTIDANGTGYVYDSAQSAIQAATAFKAAGVTSLDIGCLQVNLAQHPDAFPTLTEAFDPAANAEYAAAFLTSLDQKFGNWPQAVAAYHSQTPSLGAPYAAKVYAAWQGSPDTPSMALAAVDSHGVLPTLMNGAMPPAFEINALTPPTATLLQSGRMMDGGSLPARGLAAYRADPVAIATRLAPQG